MATTTASRSDLESLQALNRDYISSVQAGDVRRFDQILADDFLCSNPDGTLIDRAAFLKQTAQPVKIEADQPIPVETGNEPLLIRTVSDPPALRPGVAPDAFRP